MKSVKLIGYRCTDGVGTRCIHAGQEPDKLSGAVIPPISLSTTFAQHAPGEHRGYDYSRSGNPTRDACEHCLASLEDARYALTYASGLAATSNIMHLLRPEDSVIVSDDVYGGSNRIFNKVCTPVQVLRFNFKDLSDLAVASAALSPDTKLVWIETPSNPTMKLVDVRAVADIAHEANPKCLVVVDNTFLSPYFQRPLALGADLVVHSATKYLNGHSDVVMGVICLNDPELHDRLKFLQNAIGGVPSPFDAFMLLRGVKTLHVRMRQHERNALAVASLLEGSSKVTRVAYPGLKSHPQHELAKRQQRGYGGMICVWLTHDPHVEGAGLQAATRFLQALRLFTLAESLGGVESLAEHPAIMTHASVPVAQREQLGISNAMVRLSVGIEDTEDLLADVQHALTAVPTGPPNSKL
ncbi:hypothetical protein CYMTET_6847 [Cymbomonas tetramitiformis]|uniref:cystathionine gamma-lyase n=1 Tax=Cymbomonas tetramitiformis TaxID=36881 RepID=A0AAE0GWM8_9CHLO|nr:hypothetical protein CYMTET_6847 [Cymbomonas tetramitiformis]